MKYALSEVFSKFENTIKKTKLEEIKKGLETFLLLEKPDFIAVISANSVNMFVYNENYGLNFGDKPEEVLSIANSIVPNQIEEVKEIDKLIVDFYLTAGVKPFGVQFTTMFNVELIKGNIRTLVRKISLVSASDSGMPEYALVTFLDVTSTVNNDAVKNVIRIEKNVNRQVLEKTEKIKEAIDKVINKKGLLTKREYQILQLIAKGYKSETIADKLYISKATVNTHRQNMLRKYEASNVLELIHKFNL